MESFQTRTKTNVAQWAVLVDFLLDHPEMVTKSFVGLDARSHYKRLWEEVAVQLNSMGYGCKSAEKWIDAFTKWKSKVKIKAQNIIMGRKKTGGGGPLPPLSIIEEKLMSIIGWTVVEGDSTSELGLNNTITESEGRPSTSHGVTEQITPVEVEVPPLVPILKKNDTTVTEPIPSTSSANFNEPLILDRDENSQISNVKQTKRNLTGIKRVRKTVKNKKSDDITLLRMHNETLSVLKDINHNIARVADCSEAFLRKQDESKAE